MAPLINIGASVGDHTGTPGPRGWSQLINRLPNPDSTINAASGDYVGTNSQKVTAAVADAVAQGKTYVWIPKSMFGYGAATLNNAVWMLREGQNPGVFDALAYGATATLVSDQTPYLQAAIDAQHTFQTGKVWMPGGSYAITNLRYYSGSQIEGEGFVGPVNAPGTMLVQASAAQIMLQPSSTASKVSGFSFRGFGISSSGNANNLGGLDCTCCTDFSVEDVLVNGAAVFGVRVIGGNVAGDAGFGHFTRLTVNAHQTGAYAWQIGSSTLDQPDGLTFTDCRTSSQFGTWIKYSCTGAKAGPGSNVWSGCTFEAQGGNAVADITVDAAGAGPNLFIGCRFENTGSGGVQATLNGFGIQPFANFVGCLWAPGAGGFTWVDNGPVLSRRIADLNGATSDVLYQTLGHQPTLRTVTGNTTLTYNDHTVLADATGGSITLTLPAVSAVRGNLLLKIKKKDSSANTVTIGLGGLTCDGSSSNPVLTAQNQMVELQTDGTNWFIVGANRVVLAGAFPDYVLRSGGSIAFPDSTQYFQGASGQFNWAVASTVRLNLTASALNPNAASGIALGTTALPWGAIVSAQTNLGTGSSFTPNAALGSSFVGTANAATTWNAPTNPNTGQRITCTTIQDGTGGRTVAWNAVYKVSWSDTGNTLGKRSSVSFIYDGTNWNQDGAQTPYV